MNTGMLVVKSNQAKVLPELAKRTYNSSDMKFDKKSMDKLLIFNHKRTIIQTRQLNPPSWNGRFRDRVKRMSITPYNETLR